MDFYKSAYIVVRCRPPDSCDHADSSSLVGGFNANGRPLKVPVRFRTYLPTSALPVLSWIVTVSFFVSLSAPRATYATNQVPLAALYSAFGN